MSERTQIWNNGGGMQSAAIAAMIVQGKLPKPDLSVIADTGRERSTTWDYLDNIISPALKTVGVTMNRIRKEDWAYYDLYGGKDGDSLLIPVYTTRGNETGKLPGYCSGEWKRDVVRRWASKVHGVKSVTNWIGYSIDEIGRASSNKNAKKSQGKWVPSYPLIDLGMNRGDCIALVDRMGWPEPPRSSCWMCPNMRVDEWRDVKEDERDWPKVIKFDHEIRQRDPHAWLTDQTCPIDEADFDDANEVLFGRDRGACNSGMCFV